MANVGKAFENLGQGMMMLWDRQVKREERQWLADRQDNLARFQAEAQEKNIRLQDELARGRDEINNGVASANAAGERAHRENLQNSLLEGQRTIANDAAKSAERLADIKSTSDDYRASLGLYGEISKTWDRYATLIERVQEDIDKLGTTGDPEEIARLQTKKRRLETEQENQTNAMTTEYMTLSRSRGAQRISSADLEARLGGAGGAGGVGNAAPASDSTQVNPAVTDKSDKKPLQNNVGNAGNADSLIPYQLIPTEGQRLIDTSGEAATIQDAVRQRQRGNDLLKKEKAAYEKAIEESKAREAIRKSLLKDSFYANPKNKAALNKEIERIYRMSTYIPSY
jgi:hypothetical protein